MKQLSSKYALVFFLGFILLVIAFAYGRLQGGFFSGNAFLVALRYLGVGLILSGLTLWIAWIRSEAGKPGLEPLFGLLVAPGVCVLAANVLLNTGESFMLFALGGLGLVGTALLVGIVAMIISPARSSPLTTSWPEGGETVSSEHPSGQH